MPISAAPWPIMIAFTSAKSRLINPGNTIRSLIPCTPWRSTSSAFLKASIMVVFLSVTAIRRSLGMVIRVSTRPESASTPRSADSIRFLPSKVKGLVTTPIVRAPLERAISAMIGAAPVPVPPPIPEVTKTMSASWRMLDNSSRDSSAAISPISGSPPQPRPRVTLRPMWILEGASEVSSAWMSVLTAMKSTPRSLARIIRLTALLPPPPTPMTLIRALPWLVCSRSS